MKTAAAKLTASTPSGDYPLERNRITRRKRKVSVRLRAATIEDAMEDALTYRIPMEVTQILKLPNETSYPVCPRCRIAVEREYMHFCDRCGQKLDWSKLKNAFFVFPGYRSAAEKGRTPNPNPLK